jgi:hypothetical protein
LRFRFPLDINDNSKLVENIDNHTSAINFPEAVQEYVQTELRYGALKGLDNIMEFNYLHISPLMSSPKDVVARRIILDLSWHKIPVSSVNDCVPENRYLDCEVLLKLPTVDHICQISNNQFFQCTCAFIQNRPGAQI